MISSVPIVTVVLFLFTEAFALDDMPVANSSIYINSDYQFSVWLPAGFLACVDESTNHGVAILLDLTKICDGNYFQSPGIFINADYNTAEIGTTAAALAAAECRWDGAKDIVWLHGEKISGREAAGCRRRLDDGRIQVTWIVLRKTDENPLTWIQISADLITTPARYAGDMRVFGQVLPGIWVHPDGPHY